MIGKQRAEPRHSVTAARLHLQRYAGKRRSAIEHPALIRHNKLAASACRRGHVLKMMLADPMFHYRAYGLTFASDIALPELLPTQPPGPDRAADVTIRTGPDLAPPAPDPTEAGDMQDGWTPISPFAQVRDQGFCLTLPEIAQYTIRDGTTILVRPATGIDAASVRVFLLGSALGALLFQRGLLVLHGNAINMGGQAMLCLGPSGAGKSTLAAAFAARGYPVLADDVVAIDGDCAALAGIPRVKLWQDAATRLKIDTGGLARIRPELEKYHLPLDSPPADTALPVRWVYLLSKGNDDRFSLTPITGMARFRVLMTNTYRRRFMEGMALQPTHLARCGQLAGRIHLARSARPQTGFDIDGLADHLLADMAQNSASQAGAG